MSAQDLIAKWEDALAQAQLATSPDELGKEDLEAAAVPGIAARSGLRAGEDFTEEGICAATC
jgi:hypothetical protein